MSNPFVYQGPEACGFCPSPLASPSGPAHSPHILSPGRLSLHSRPILDHQFQSPPSASEALPSLPSANTSSSPKFDTMNYSPRHSRKPSSLTSNRNISMKNLLLDLTSNDNGLLYHSSSSGSSATDLPSKTPLRRKTLNLSIPAKHPSKPSPPSALHTRAQTVLVIESLTTPNVTKTPLFPPPIPTGLRSSSSLDVNVTSDKFQFPTFNEPHESYEHPYDLQSPFGNGNAAQESSPSTPLVNSFNSINLSVDKVKNVPEELQELSQLDAYPDGPASVLNDTMFLFSEPSVEEVGHYDLVINVAKECKDLTSQFADYSGKKYIYIPWSHTSPILKELPALVKLIKQFDDSDRLGKKRKILIHCHCGVSRSACVIVAYFMLKFKINVNEAYELLKSGTNNVQDKVNRHIKAQGYTIDACSRVCPNMSLIFELMDFNDYLKSVNYVV